MATLRNDLFFKKHDDHLLCEWIGEGKDSYFILDGQKHLISDCYLFENSDMHTFTIIDNKLISLWW